jgi:hypothetical protein
MADGYTELGFILQETGANETVWGGYLNSSALNLIDQAIRGRVAFALSGTKTLTSTNGVDTEGRKAILHATSGTGGTVTVPGYSKLYVVINDTAGPLIITAGGATNVTFQAGDSGLVACDGAGTVKKVQTNDFGASRLTNVGSPTATTDAVTKAYADALVFGSVVGEFPALPGNGGRALKVQADESAPLWDVGPQVKSADFTADRGASYLVNTASAAVTATLPASPQNGDVIRFADGGFLLSTGGWATYALTIARNGKTIMGLAENMTATTRALSFGLTYQSGDWRVIQ